MKKWQTGLLVIIILAIVVAGGYIYKNRNNNSASTNTTTASTVNAEQSKVITYSGEDGKTVYDILKAKYSVDAKDSSSGVMVNSINGLAATTSEFWLYSVNGTDATVAADKYFTKADDQIKWEYKGF